MEIIPKSSQRSPFMKALIVLSIGVCAIAAGGFLLLLFLQSRTQDSIEKAEALLGAEKTIAQAQLEQEVFLARVRLQDFKNLVGQRKDVLGVFSFLQDVVHPDVTFLSMSVDAIAHTMQVRGEAKSFLALDEQLAILQGREEPDSIVLTDLQIAQGGGVNFRMELQFPSAFFQ